MGAASERKRCGRANTVIARRASGPGLKGGGFLPLPREVKMKVNEHQQE